MAVTSSLHATCPRKICPGHDLTGGYTKGWELAWENKSPIHDNHCMHCGGTQTKEKLVDPPPTPPTPHPHWHQQWPSMSRTQCIAQPSHPMCNCAGQARDGHGGNPLLPVATGPGTPPCSSSPCISQSHSPRCTPMAMSNTHTHIQSLCRPLQNTTKGAAVKL
jgi:hypothetical protein